MKLSFEQKKSLSNYSGNLSIAWFAAGIIGPIVTKQTFKGMEAIMLFSVLASGVFLIFMLILVRKRKRNK